ncbi:MAG: sigma-54 dependent transcriptional regulator [Helicobacteraceae bacterium]|jgi:two-component system NtrC family response regulator|nr:sigma-54 dependent transcriptional regulator [Helicobacteraceae bacterium]
MKIAIVEDDINVRKSLEAAFAERGEFEVVSFKNAKDALKKLDDTYELVVTDLTMPFMDGLEFLRELNGRYEAIVITGNATLNKAVEAMRLGVKDFLQKPFEIDALIEAIRRAKKAAQTIEKAARIAPAKHKEAAKNEFFIVSSSALERPRQVALKTAKTDAAVMLLGESGVGKEIFAGFIHFNSPRSEKPFVPINMAALPDALIESELFGFEKGAFTDAQASKPGRFEEANGGTLFLDEIAEMPYALQAKLLRVIQEKRFRRLGGLKDIEIDVRLISATNQNIGEAIMEGRFREDLYYRLNTIEIAIPPLRERKEEILPLAEATLLNACERYGFTKKSFSDAAKEELLNYGWYGNVRELISVCERSAIISEGDLIDANDLFLRARSGAKSVESLEKELIVQALGETRGNAIDAANLLGMPIADFEAKRSKYKISL